MSEEKPKEKYECKHNFFPVKNGEQDKKGEKLWINFVIITCCWCGQVRELNANGEVAVIKQKGNIRHEF